MRSILVALVLLASSIAGAARYDAPILVAMTPTRAEQQALQIVLPHDQTFAALAYNDISDTFEITIFARQDVVRTVPVTRVNGLSAAMFASLIQAPQIVYYYTVTDPAKDGVMSVFFVDKNGKHNLATFPIPVAIY